MKFLFFTVFMNSRCLINFKKLIVGQFNLIKFDFCYKKNIIRMTKLSQIKQTCPFFMKKFAFTHFSLLILRSYVQVLNRFSHICYLLFRDKKENRLEIRGRGGEMFVSHIIAISYNNLFIFFRHISVKHFLFILPYWKRQIKVLKNKYQF